MPLSDLIGAELPTKTIVVERGPASFFARAVTENDPVFHDADKARVDGFDSLPTVPTYAFAMHHMGTFPELQEPSAEIDPERQAMNLLMRDGGIVLHGEQEFVYHRPVQVGDRLTGRGRIDDISTREGSDGKQMTFVVSRTDWFDEAGAPVVSSTMTLIHRI